MSKTNKNNKDVLIDSIKSQLYAIGIPVEQLRVKKIDNALKIIPIGELDLDKFCSTFQIENEFLTSVTFNGVERNTEFILTFTAKEDKSEAAKETLRIIENKIDKEIDKALEMSLFQIKPNFENFEDRIPGTIRENYKITGDFSTVREWKALVYEANSQGRGEPGKGGMGNVGYTMIDLDTGLIVPIARSDEHNMGGDLIYKLVRSKKIPKGNYYPVYFGNNYAFSDEPSEVKRTLKAFKIWRDNGGENTTVSNGGNNRNLDYTVKMDDYIKSEGKISIPKGEILPMGQRIVRYLEKCATTIKDHHLGKNVKLDMVCNYAELIIKELSGSYSFFSETEELGKSIYQYKNDGDIKKLEEALFSHNGFKNKIHMDIRHGVKEPGSIKARDAERIFGDLEVANSEFDRLGSI